MALSVNLSSINRTENGFEATGEVSGKAFTASTITFGGNLIFKILEPNDEGELVHKIMADSEFSRGERIAVARFLKGARVDFEANENPSVEALEAMGTKALRKLAKARGLKGYSAKGVRKEHLVAMLTPVTEDASEDEAAA
tara:strand:- start:218 stop:640 length:423 start_codon:yes stop_codon:yes gene_type:complete